MKTRLLRLLALVLTVAALCPALVACADIGEPVIAYKKAEITDDVYRYWLACYRAQYAALDNGQNTEELAAAARANIARSLVCVGLFDGYGLTLDLAARDVVNAAVARIEETLGGREALEAELAVWGMTVDGLKVAITYEQKAAALRDHLFGEEGAYLISAEDAEAYYQENYARVYMIFIPYVDFETDANGNRIFDPVTQSYRYKNKSASALTSQKEKAAAIRTAAAGEGFDLAAFQALSDSYNGDESAKTYTNGYYFSRIDDYSTYIREIPAAALTMQVGEVREITSEYGVHFLFRAENDKGAYEKEENADFFASFAEGVTAYAFEALISSQLPFVEVVNAELYNSIRYEEIQPNYGVYWG